MYRIGDDWVFQQYVKEITKPKLREGDFYYDINGQLVYTKEYLKNLKECCGGNCKHCSFNGG